MITRAFSGAIALLLASTAPLLAQPAPIKWGDVSEDELKMTTYPADTNAAAVILADFGEVTFNSDLSFMFRRHRRIKILKESGYEWGTYQIPYYDSRDGSKVTNLDGHTLKIGPDGKVQRHKLDKKAIFRENVNGEWKQVRFTLPVLEPGAVVEYRYDVHYKLPIVIPEWPFQTGEPTLWSEYRVEIPGKLAFVRATTGSQAFHIEESLPVHRPAGEGRLVRMVMKDAPAIRNEPFMTTPEDYRSRVRFQLSAYHDGFSAQQFLSTWDETAKLLMDLESFGRRLGRGRAVRDQVATLTAGIENPAAQLEVLYDYVRANINWNGKVGILLDQEIPDVLKTRSGSLPEINLLLVSLLREAGLDAHPVLISSRSHGSIIPEYPLLDQFDRVLAYARIDGSVYLMDATDPLRPYTLLPVEALNGKGWLVREGKKAEWIPIEAGGKLRRQAAITASLDENGVLTGTILTSEADYSAIMMRQELKDAKDEETFFRESLLGELDEVTIESYGIENEDAVMELLKTEADFSALYGQPAGDFIYLNPVLVDRHEENPLRLPERTFPVDLAHPWDLNYSVRLKVPEGYTVHEAPSSKRIGMGSGGALFTRMIEVKDGELALTSRLVLSKAVFPPEQYAELRKFFDEIVAAQAEQVVLKRKDGGELGASGG